MRRDNPHDSIAARKLRLIEQGASLRAELADARRQIGQGLHAAPLAKGVLASVAGAAFGMFRGSMSGKLSLIRALFPLLAGGASALWSSKSRRPIIYTSALIGLGVLASRLIARKKKSASG